MNDKSGVWGAASSGASPGRREMLLLRLVVMAHLTENPLLLMWWPCIQMVRLFEEVAPIVPGMVALYTKGEDTTYLPYHCTRRGGLAYKW